MILAGEPMGNGGQEAVGATRLGLRLLALFALIGAAVAMTPPASQASGGIGIESINVQMLASSNARSRPQTITASDVSVTVTVTVKLSANIAKLLDTMRSRVFSQARGYYAITRSSADTVTFALEPQGHAELVYLAFDSDAATRMHAADETGTVTATAAGGLTGSGKVDILRRADIANARMNYAWSPAANTTWVNLFADNKGPGETLIDFTVSGLGELQWASGTGSVCNRNAGRLICRSDISVLPNNTWGGGFKIIGGGWESMTLTMVAYSAYDNYQANNTTTLTVPYLGTQPLAQNPPAGNGNAAPAIPANPGQASPSAAGTTDVPAESPSMASTNAAAVDEPVLEALGEQSQRQTSVWLMVGLALVVAAVPAMWIIIRRRHTRPSADELDPDESRALVP